MRMPNAALTAKRMDTLVQKRYAHEQNYSNVDVGCKEAIEVAIGTKYKRRPLCQLTSQDVDGILRSVKEDKWSHQEAADLYGVKATLVYQLVSNDKKDQTFLEKR